jgi:hypothetical protein
MKAKCEHIILQDATPSTPKEWASNGIYSLGLAENSKPLRVKAVRTTLQGGEFRIPQSMVQYPTIVTEAN